MSALGHKKLLAAVVAGVMLLTGCRSVEPDEPVYTKVTVNGFVEAMESLNFRYSLFYNDGDMELLGAIYNNYSYYAEFDSANVRGDNHVRCNVKIVEFQTEEGAVTAYNYMVGQLKTMAEDEEYADVTVFSEEDASDRNNFLFRTDMAGESPDPINVASDYRYVGIYCYMNVVMVAVADYESSTYFTSDMDDICDTMGLSNPANMNRDLI